ncbi:MAG: hypothetical protein MK089_01885 [Phycisphaerales bacterium]|nr:hypothetical protein [Phycisphaerales bacterium]
MPKAPAKTVILCPMKVEADALKRAGIRWPIRITGMGQKATEQAVKEVAASHGPDLMLILAGVAGGLSHEVSIGEAFEITHVTDPAGTSLTPVDCTSTTPSLCTVDAIVETLEDRLKLHETTGADLVDMESSHFIKACEPREVGWMVFRGVSDDVESAIPPGCEHFIDARGYPRICRILASLALHPWRIPAMVHLARSVNLGMAGVSRLIHEKVGTPDKPVRP